MRIIEENVPFAQSAVWSLQRQYYSQMSIRAWSNHKIPYFITANPVIANAYANMAAGFLRDIRAQNTDIVYILELGAGHGRFTYQFLKHFNSLKCLLNLPPVCYIASDLSSKNVEFMESHPKMRPFLESAMLDFAVWDAETDTKIVLRHAKKVIDKASLTQPLIVIANYLLDSISQDVFYINDNQLNTCLLTIKTQQDEPGQSLSFDNLLLVPSYKKLDKAAFGEQYLCDVLEDYRDMQDTHLLFPSSGIRALERLRSLSGGRLMFLTCDKGYNCREMLEGLPFPEFVHHDNNAFSLMVNYHAFQTYCRKNSGLALYPRQNYLSISVECLLFLENAQDCVETQLAYKNFIDCYGPDEFCSVSTILSNQITEISFEQWVSIIRHSGYDSDTFMCYVQPLYNLIVELPPKWKKELLVIVRKVWDMHYPLDKGLDIALELGKILIVAGFVEEAVKYFNLSVNTWGYQRETVQNLMFCYCYIEDYDSGIHLLETLRRQNQ